MMMEQYYPRSSNLSSFPDFFMSLHLKVIEMSLSMQIFRNQASSLDNYSSFINKIEIFFSKDCVNPEFESNLPLTRSSIKSFNTDYSDYSFFSILPFSPFLGISPYSGCFYYASSSIFIFPLLGFSPRLALFEIVSLIF